MRWRSQGTVTALAAASAVGALGGAAWWCFLRARRRWRLPSSRSRKARLSRHAGSDACGRLAPPPPPGSAGELRARLTVILTTSPVGRHPSTDLIDEVIGSTRLADGVSDCDLIIVCDGYRSANSEGTPYTECRFRQGIVDATAASNYEAYKGTLRRRAEERAASSPPGPALKVLELETRHGFGFAVKAALEHVRTKYVLVMQHDRPFTRRADVPRVLAAMEAHPDRIKYVGLPTQTTVTHQSYVLSKYRIRIEPWQADDSGLLMMPLIQWYDSTHLCEVEYYRKFVFGPRRLVARGGFIEDKFGQAQLADIRARGVEAAHPSWGTFIAAGDSFAEPVVGHLDGRDALNASKFIWTKGEVAAEAEMLQQQEVASRLARTAVSGEAPASVSTAAAMAAEAARLRVAESKRIQAELDKVAGQDAARQSERPPVSKAAGLAGGMDRQASAPSLPRELWKEYLVDNADLKADTPGLGFRLSKHLDDRAGDQAAEWGSTIMGVDLADGWLRVHGDRYLPTHLCGKRVLSLADGRGHTGAAGAPLFVPQPRQRGAVAAKVRAFEVRNGYLVAGGADAGTPSAATPASAAQSLPGRNAQGSFATGNKMRKPLPVPPSGPPAGLKVPNRGCPTNGWQYVDPKGNIQGPFGLPEMQHWHSKRYFSDKLPMRCSVSDEFVPFKDLFPPPLTPFQDPPVSQGKAATSPEASAN